MVGNEYSVIFYKCHCCKIYLKNKNNNAEMFGAQECPSDFAIIPPCSINQANKIWIHFQEQLLLRHSFNNAGQSECIDCHLYRKKK